MPLTQKSIILLAFFISITFFSCIKNDQPEISTAKATLHDYTGLDGCSWIIRLDNNEALEPSSLGESNVEFIEGKKVWVKYSIAENQFSICMVGQKVDIIDMWER